MSFIRVKNILSKQYGYLVENTWTKKGSRQAVKGYLGRIHTLKDRKELTFEFEDKFLKRVYKDLVRWELLCHGFSKDLEKENIKVNLSEETVRKGNKKIVLAMNEGFMCDYTLRQLFNFKPKGNEDETALQLANILVETGIKVPHDVFVKIYEKLVQNI